ncbi:MAG: oligopeptide/dipeptide ABC transporter ATP-binding protein [Planctomycetota bacterium]
MSDPADTARAQAEPLLEVRGLKTSFPVRRGLLRRRVGEVRAVDNVSLTIHKGETLGLVGESGCGKSTVGRTLLRLTPSTAGEVVFDGQDVLAASSGALRKLRRRMQVVFQDPMGSLNPRMTVGRIVGEPLEVHKICTGAELRSRVETLLTKVGLQPQHAERYPHEFSGGQRQRIGIARALSLGPEFVVLDEPVSALDVSVQSQVLNLLADLRQEFGLSYLFIAHNLAVVEHFCDRIAVMYLGRIVELASRDALYDRPMHPYTQALLSAAPTPDPTRQRDRVLLLGDVPSPIVLDKDEREGGAARAQKRLDAEKAELEAERQPGVRYLGRSSLLDRPDLVEVPGDPGHWVSPGPGVELDGQTS